MLCPLHKFELAINDAFGSSLLNNATEDGYTEVYYFFKKSPLRWRLFKRQSLFMDTPVRRYKTLTGTRWVEHRVAALDSYLDNLATLIGFCDQQIRAPHTHHQENCSNSPRNKKKGGKHYILDFHCSETRHSRHTACNEHDLTGNYAVITAVFDHLPNDC